MIINESVSILTKNFVNLPASIINNKCFRVFISYKYPNFIGTLLLLSYILISIFDMPIL